MAETIEIVTLNCWGLKYISKFTTERVLHIIHELRRRPCDIVCLQEIWQEEHWQLLQSRLRDIFPYSKYYWSGMMGAGLAILSRWPISQTDMRPYTLNGRPQAFFRGDWFVGKGVASAVVDLPNGRQCQVFNTHLHAPYNEKVDTYLCHRTAQGWDLRKMLKASVQSGYITFATGDFNSLPGSLVHRFLTTYLSDSFITLNPDLPLLPDQSLSAQEMVEIYGVTCDVSPTNTWRRQQAPGMAPKRLDYVFHDDQVVPQRVCVDFIDLVRDLNCSVSDHFGLRCTYELKQGAGSKIYRALHFQDYEEILTMLQWYSNREHKHSHLRIAHFWLSIAIIVAYWILIPISSNKLTEVFSSFLVLLIGVSGTLDGLIGAFFGWWERSGLREFEDEICRAAALHKALAERT